MHTNEISSVNKRLLTMSTLGRNGRFGNQIFQYAFLRIYAQRHGLEVRVPQWIGEYLFGHRDARPGDDRLPLFHDQVEQATILNQLLAPLVNADVCGYFQYGTDWYLPSRELFRDLFRPVPEIETPLKAAIEKLRAGGRTVIGIHVRRGDFAGGIHYSAPAEWYVKWLIANWSKWKSPVLLLASDELAKVAGDFAQFKPVTSGDMGVSVPPAAYYPDYYMLSQCDVMAISNSSFSFSAAMLNERASVFVRPSRAAEGLIEFNPWNSEPSLHEGSRDEQAAFYDRTYTDIAAAVGQLREKKAGAVEAVRTGRRFLANLWLGMNDDTLRIVYNTRLADAQRLLVSIGRPDSLDNADEQQFATDMGEQLQKAGPGGVWSIQYLLAAMLYYNAEELPIEHDILMLPQWLQADYISYLRQAAHDRK